MTERALNSHNTCAQKQLGYIMCLDKQVKANNTSFFFTYLLPIFRKLINVNYSSQLENRIQFM